MKIKKVDMKRITSANDHWINIFYFNSYFSEVLHNFEFIIKTTLLYQSTTNDNYFCFSNKNLIY